jgi:spore germination cell wall hydrolase CwlJ-like protein
MKKNSIVALGIAFLVYLVVADKPTPPPVETETETDLHETETEVVTIEPPTMEEVAEPSETETEVDIETEIETEIDTEVEITYYSAWMDRYFTEDEFALICTTVFCESGGCNSKTQRMVALTILNQINSGKFGDTVREVIYKKNNFSVTKWKDFENRGWTSKVEQSVLDALEENEHPRDMYYFRTSKYHDFGKPYKRSENVYFSTHK